MSVTLPWTDEHGFPVLHHRDYTFIHVETLGRHRVDVYRKSRLAPIRRRVFVRRSQYFPDVELVEEYVQGYITSLNNLDLVDSRGLHTH